MALDRLYRHLSHQIIDVFSPCLYGIGVSFASFLGGECLWRADSRKKGSLLHRQVSGFFKVARYWLPDHRQDWVRSSIYPCILMAHGHLAHLARQSALAQDRRSMTYNHRALNDAEDAIDAMRQKSPERYSVNMILKFRNLEQSQVDQGSWAVSLPAELMFSAKLAFN